MIAAIVAVDNNWGIGYNNDLLEHIPADLKNFKELTTGNAVVMGRKTWDSLPKKPLPNRTNIVLTRRFKHQSKQNDPNTWTYITDDDLTNLEIMETYKDFFVIGGGEIYKQLLPKCSKVYVTKIYKDHENIDTYFPNLDESEDWKGFATSEIKEYNDLKYQFWEYDRIS